MNRQQTTGRAGSRRRWTALALLCALLAGLALSACGSSGKSTSSASTTTGTTSASSTSPSRSRGRFGARASALRKCLKEHGITLPERKPGQRGGPFGGQGGFKLPSGVSRQQLQEAFQKCGGLGGGARPFAGGRNPQRLAQFATCMRQNGVNVPAPNTSGKGPVFDTKGIDTGGETFKKALAKCQPELRPPGAGAGPGGPPGGEPPA